MIVTKLNQSSLMLYSGEDNTPSVVTIETFDKNSKLHRKLSLITNPDFLLAKKTIKRLPTSPMVYSEEFL